MGVVGKAGLVFVAGCAIYGLESCATPDVVCDMRTDYTTEAPEAMEGVVLTRWMYRRDAYLAPGTNGLTECWGPIGDSPRFCLVQMRGTPSSFRNVCGVARVRHEEKHTWGAEHAQ